MREEASSWLTQAQRDLKTAQHLLESKDCYASVLFSHQGCERALKAAHMELKRRRAYTHNLARLAGDLGLEEELLSELRDLSPEYFVIMHPDAAEGPIDDLYDEAKAERSIRTAQKVISWTRRQLKR